MSGVCGYVLQGEKHYNASVGAAAMAASLFTLTSAPSYILIFHQITNWIVWYWIPALSMLIVFLWKQRVREALSFSKCVSESRTVKSRRLVDSCRHSLQRWRIPGLCRDQALTATAKTFSPQAGQRLANNYVCLCWLHGLTALNNTMVFFWVSAACVHCLKND